MVKKTGAANKFWYYCTICPYILLEKHVSWSGLCLYILCWSLEASEDKRMNYHTIHVIELDLMIIITLKAVQSDMAEVFLVGAGFSTLDTLPLLLSCAVKRSYSSRNVQRFTYWLYVAAYHQQLKRISILHLIVIIIHDICEKSLHPLRCFEIINPAEVFYFIFIN